MKRLPKWPGWIILGVGLGISTLSGCEDDPSAAEQIRVDQISISPASLVGIEVDTTIQLQARVLDAAGHPVNVAVAWQTDNPAVATVSNTGLLQTHDNGTVRITATAGLRTAQLLLNVEHHAAAVLFVSPPQAIRVANEYRLQIRVLDPHGTELQRTMQWTSLNPDIVTVDQNGMLKALRAGTATITVTGDGVTATMQVTVMATVAAVSIEPGPQTLRIGQTVQLTARVRDSEGNLLGDRTVQWTSSNPGLASVDNNGVVTALAAGNVVITALSDGVAATVALVIGNLVKTVSVVPAQTTLNVGGTATLRAIALDGLGVEVVGGSVTWTSSNTGVVVVDASGVATAIRDGIANITAVIDNVSGTAQVIVPAQVTSLLITPQVTDLDIGEELTLLATLLNPSGTVVNAPVTWVSSAAGIGTVSRSGVVKGVSEGTVTITASAGGVSASVVINIGPPVASIEFDAHPPINLVVGETYQLQPVVKDAAGNVLINRVLKYTSADENVATVSSSGLVTATGSGTVDITAAKGQVSTTVSVRVHPRVHGVQIMAGQGTMQPGQSQQLTAVLKDAAGNSIPGRTAVWTSSNPEVATVDDNGMVTAVATGTTTITATIDGASAVALITVVVGVTRIEIIDPRSEPDQPIMVGATMKFAAKAYDAANAEISGLTFSWTSSSPAIASVDGTGLVTGIARGTTVITASAGGVSDQVDLRVAGSGQGSGGGGEEDGYGANLSVPVIFTEGLGLTGLPVTTDPGMRPLSTEAAAGLAPSDGVGTFFYSGNVPDCPQGSTAQYYCQRGANTWRAEWRNGAGTPINATASWGDNLTHQTWRTTIPIRVEVMLTDPTRPLQGFNMPYVSGQGMSESQGTDGTTASMIPTLYSRTPRLIIEKLSGEGGTPVHRLVDKRHYASVDGPGNFVAEVTVSGKIVYGFQLKVNDYTLPAGVSADGWYRLTFRLDNMSEGAPVNPNVSITAIGNTSEDEEELAYMPQVGQDGRSTFIDIYVTGGTPGGGGDPGGDEDEYGANLSVPVIFTEGLGLSGAPVASDPGMRPFSTEAAAGLAPANGVGTFFYSGNVADCPTSAPQYFCQRSANTWRAEWRNGLGGPINATAFWGDNLTHQTWRTTVPIRVEVMLTDPATTLQGFNMPYVSGQGSSESQGTDGSTAAMVPTLYSRTPRLIIEKLSGEGGSVVHRLVDKRHYASVDGPGNFVAEVTVSGKIVYGFQLKVNDYTLPQGIPADGWYRFTFQLDNVSEGAPVNPNVTITAIGNTSEDEEELVYMPQVGADGRSTYIEVYITGGGTGSGGAGGGKPTASVSIATTSGTVAAGGTVQLTATVLDEDGNVVSDRTVSWTSSDPTIATVDATGKVTGIKQGSVIITAESEGHRGQAPITVGPGGQGGGGGDEGLGNNLSWPVTFAEGIGLTGLPVATDPGLRPTAEENVVVSSLPFFRSSNTSDCQITTASVMLLYCQQAQNVWQAQWLDASTQGVRNASVQWGDNLTHHTWNSHSPIRIEVVLNDLTTGPMQGYNMFYVSGQGPDEMQGTDGTLSSFVPTIYSVTPRLIAERIDTIDGNPVAGTRAVNIAVWQSLNADGPGGFGAEVNVAGKVIFGYNFNVQSVDNTGWPVHKYGWWRLTFKLDGVADGAPVNPNVLLSALAAIAATDEEGETLKYTPKVATDGKSTWVDIYIQSASGGSGGGGGHSGGGGHVTPRAELITKYTAELPSSLHGTAKGMDYWYSVPSGYGSQINVSYQTLNTCKGCHVYNPTLTKVPVEQVCLACHGPSAADPVQPDYDVVDNGKCLNCHGRQSAEIAMGMTDVHRSAGMGCSDCHKAADVHGGVTDNTMLETITTSCGSCHKSSGAAGTSVNVPNTASHTQHTNVACQTCHMSGTVTCYNCHLDDELTKGARVAFKRIGNWTFLGNWKGKVYPVNFTSVEYQGETFNAWGPFTGHNIQKAGKPCAACHDNQFLKTYDAQGEVRLTTWDPSTSTLANVGGVIPITPDYATAFKFDYITKNPAGVWTFLETGPDRSQMLYATPLTAEQLDRLRAPQ